MIKILAPCVVLFFMISTWDNKGKAVKRIAVTVTAAKIPDRSDNMLLLFDDVYIFLIAMLSLSNTLAS